jgi:hypothetical protein
LVKREESWRVDLKFGGLEAPDDDIKIIIMQRSRSPDWGSKRTDTSGGVACYPKSGRIRRLGG